MFVFTAAVVGAGTMGGEIAQVIAAADIDRRYAEGLARAVAAGVEAIAWDCAITTERITLRHPLPVLV